MTCITDRFYGIRAVALEIAYDNGFINRFMPEDIWLASLDEVLGAEGVVEERLREIDWFCCDLTNEEQVTFAMGDYDDIVALYGHSTVGQMAHGLMNDIFEHGCQT